MKRRSILSIILVAVVLICHATANPVIAVAAPLSKTGMTVNAKSAILMEPSSGKIILEQNPHDKLAPASVTKIMTLLLIYEAIDNGKITWNDRVSVSEHAASMGGSQIYLEPGEMQSVQDLVKSIAIASANDAAVCMAEYIGGSEDSFVNMMNARAKELGMQDTNFENACGLDADGHLTSAYDIAVMSSELVSKHPEVFEFTTLWQDSITHSTKRGDEPFGLTNTNKLLKWYNGATGLKTGSTGKALYCLSGTASRNGLSLVAVVMAAPDYKTRFQEVMKMFDYGFVNYGVSSGEKAGTKMGQITVYKGDVEHADVIIKDEIKILHPKGAESQITSKIDILPSVNAPAEKGCKVGDIVYYLDGEEAGRSDLVLDVDIAKAGLSNMMKRVLFKWFE